MGNVEEMMKWAENRLKEAEGNWETEKYHEGYKDAMNDLIKILKLIHRSDRITQ